MVSAIKSEAKNHISWQGSFNRVLLVDSGDISELSLTQNIQPSGLKVSQVIIECEGSHAAT